MKPNDYLTPEFRKMIKQQQDILKNIPDMNNNPYVSALKNMNVTIPSFNDSYNEFFNSYSNTINANLMQQYSFDDLIPKNTKKLIDSFNKMNIPDMSAYHKIIVSINEITANNPFLGISLTDTLNSIVENGNFTSDNAIQNLVSAMGPETTKSVFESMNKIMDQNFNFEESDSETSSVNDYSHIENDNQYSKYLDFQRIQDKFSSLSKSKREKIINTIPEITSFSSDYFLRNYPLTNYLVQIIAILLFLALFLKKDD